MSVIPGKCNFTVTPILQSQQHSAIFERNDKKKFYKDYDVPDSKCGSDTVTCKEKWGWFIFQMDSWIWAKHMALIYAKKLFRCHAACCFDLEFFPEITQFDYS